MKFVRVLLAASMLLLPTACHRVVPAAPKPPDLAGHKLAIPAHGIYAGAYMDFGDLEDTVTLEKIESFEELVGKHQAIVASSSYWGEGTFPDRNVRLIHRHHAIPLIFWSPWDRPYDQNREPDRFALTRIIAGEHDAYIDQWADAARAVGQPILVSFANEMNGTWFPWSGLHYGAGNVVPGPESPSYAGPETFKAAWRHVVDRVRARGATNVEWVFHSMDFSTPNEPWNVVGEYYPGPDYVDWMGFSLYGSQFPSDDGYPDFLSCFDWPYTEMADIDPSKPIMVCEWGVGEFPQKGNKGDWMRGAFATMQDTAKYPRLKAAVFWNERWQNSVGENNADDENAGKYSDLRVNSSVDSLQGFRAGIASPFFLSEPQAAP